MNILPTCFSTSLNLRLGRGFKLGWLSLFICCCCHTLQLLVKCTSFFTLKYYWRREPQSKLRFFIGLLIICKPLLEPFATCHCINIILLLTLLVKVEYIIYRHLGKQGRSTVAWKWLTDRANFWPFLPESLFTTRSNIASFKIFPLWSCISVILLSSLNLWGFVLCQLIANIHS